MCACMYVATTVCTCVIMRMCMTVCVCVCDCVIVGLCALMYMRLHTCFLGTVSVRPVHITGGDILFIHHIVIRTQSCVLWAMSHSHTYWTPLFVVMQTRLLPFAEWVHTHSHTHNTNSHNTHMHKPTHWHPTTQGQHMHIKSGVYMRAHMPHTHIRTHAHTNIQAYTHTHIHSTIQSHTHTTHTQPFMRTHMRPHAHNH